MTTLDSAKEIARHYVASLKVAPGVELVLVDQATIQKPFGWVFFYNSKKFLETRDFRDSVIGAPFIVDRRDGSLHPLKSAPPVQFYIEKYEREHPFNPRGVQPPAMTGGPGLASTPAAPKAAASSQSGFAATSQPGVTPHSDLSEARRVIRPAHGSVSAEVRTQAQSLSRPSVGGRRLVLIGATLIIALGALFGWLRYRQTAAKQVPVLVQYAPKNVHSMIRAVSLSSSMSPDFDPARVGTKFDKGISSAVLWYRWANATPGRILEISWSKEGSEILRQRLQISKPSGEQAYALRTPDGSALPDGNYQVTLIEAGQPVTTIPFQIGAAKPLAPGGAGIAR